MKVRIIVAGKPALAYAKQGVEEYCQRLRRMGDFEIIHVKAGSSEEVSQRLLEKSNGSLRIALDERGEKWTTLQFAEKFFIWQDRGDIKSVSFLIGAADGHTAELRTLCDAVLSLSALTTQHELALVLLLEQLYRITSIKQGSPYHRE